MPHPTARFIFPVRFVHADSTNTLSQKSILPRGRLWVLAARLPFSYCVMCGQLKNLSTVYKERPSVHYTLLEKFRRITLHVTADAIAKLCVT